MFETFFNHYIYHTVGKRLYTKCWKTRAESQKGWLQPQGKQYRRSTNIEVSEATYNCKIGFLEFFSYPKIALILTITWYFDTPSKVQRKILDNISDYTQKNLL